MLQRTSFAKIQNLAHRKKTFSARKLYLCSYCEIRNPMTNRPAIIRDAQASDSPFLAQCILAGFHLYDFESEGPKDKKLYLLLNECIKREDLLYTFKFARIAEVDGAAAGAL